MADKYTHHDQEHDQKALRLHVGQKHVRPIAEATGPSVPERSRY
jgi:hypothetical protein